MTAIADQHERYRGFLIDLRYFPGRGWIVQWGERWTGRQRSHEAGLPTAGRAAALAYALIDDQYRLEADAVCFAAFGTANQRTA